MSRKEAKEETREALLRGARKVFTQKGVSSAKVADIVAAAGVAQGTFYVHFRSKSEVVDRLVSRFNRRHGTILVKLATQHMRAGTHAVIRAQARAHIAYWRANADLLPVVVDHIARHSDGEPLLLRDVNDAIAAFADEVTRSGDIERRAPPREIARIIVTLWRQSGLHVARDATASEEEAARTLELCTVAIYDALAPGLTDMSTRALARAYRSIVNAAKERRASRR